MHLQLPKLFVIIVLLSLIIFPFVAPLSFNFISFSPDDNRIKYERAYPANNAIQLTKDLAELARATYAKPIQLWDDSSRNMADFNTHFSFVMDSQNRTPYADGVTFFLAPNGSRIPDGTTAGFTLALTADNQPLSSTGNPFVAVEFDIYHNDWDPPNDHVGIDINSLKSVRSTTWRSKILDGRQNDAWISYDSNSKNLCVAFTGFASDNTTIQQGLYYIVDLRDYLPEWITVGFSASTGTQSAIQSIHSWNFSSTDLPIHGPNYKGKAKLWVRLGPSLAGGIVLVVLVFVASILACRKWKNRPQNRSRNNPDELESDVPGPKKLSYKELARATNNFASGNKIGEGSFGGVYRGHLRESNVEVAVKKKSRDSPQGIKEYKSEVKTISGLRYRNLVRLIGWCRERKGFLCWWHNKEELLLVYEFMPNGSLYSHLYNNNTLLKWVTRYRIAQGLASALLYLQEEWERNRYVVHRDIKSKNVLLDLDFNPKLGDFGLARVVSCGQHVQTAIEAGTIEYMAPECLNGRAASKESDVYSFGIVALEIATGRKPNGTQRPTNPGNIVNCVRESYRTNNLLGSADPGLGTNFDEQEMKRLLIVGLWCADPDNSRRPSIMEVVRTLNSSNEDSLSELSLRFFEPPVNDHGSPIPSQYFVTATGST